MKKLLPFSLMISLCLTGCTKSVEPAENYLVSAARHCNYGQNQLGWLQSIVTSEQYTKPSATVPAPIRQITLSDYNGGPALLLDSDLSACMTCPWAILDCNGQAVPSTSGPTPVRDKVIWKR